MKHWKGIVDDIYECLNGLNCTDRKREFTYNQSFSWLLGTTKLVKELSSCVYCIGNGASAALANHFSADLFKSSGVMSLSYTNVPLLTSIANDEGYEDVFAMPVREQMKEYDMLVAISSSGESNNIIGAVIEAKKKGAKVVTLSAMKPDNRLRKLGHMNLWVPADTYSLAESCHAVILHHWIDLVAEDANGTTQD